MLAWNEVFKLLGNCIGKSVEVDWRTTSKEQLLVVRVKVLLDRPISLPTSMALWVDDFKYYIQIEEDRSFPQFEESKRIVGDGDVQDGG